MHTIYNLYIVYSSNNNPQLWTNLLQNVRMKVKSNIYEKVHIWFGYITQPGAKCSGILATPLPAHTYMYINITELAIALS